MTAAVALDRNSRRELIKNRRAEMGMSQLMLARAVGVSQATIQKIESGEISGSKFLPDIFAKLELPLVMLNPIYAQSAAAPREKQSAPAAEHGSLSEQILTLLRRTMASINATDLVVRAIIGANGGDPSVMISVFREDGTTVDLILPLRLSELLASELPRIHKELRGRAK